jgi:GDP-mannose 6-dehydrogenase
MKVSVFGLGYVGAVTAACLARDGHEVIGVDTNLEKVQLVSSGKSPIVEPGLEQLLQDAVQRGLLRATIDAEDAVVSSDVSLISVGTPPDDKGEPELSYVINVCKQIGTAIREKGLPHTVVLRSTVPPGTLDRCSAVITSLAGGVPVYTAFNPEFLREGSALRDYDDAPYTIIGTDNSFAENVVRTLYCKLSAPIFVVRPKVAEMVKYVANSWHATKISFANEIGRISKAFGVDGEEVMRIIVEDRKLNTSAAYLKPGFAYGGSCLPKDVAALIYYSRKLDVATPLLESLPVTNQLEIDLAVQQVLKWGTPKVAVLGLAFKRGTDDLRNSPYVDVVKRLIGEGCSVKIYDEAVYRARMVGTNLEYIRRNLPHFEELLVGDIDEALADVECVVISHRDPLFKQKLQQNTQVKTVDLAGLLDSSAKGETHSASAVG